MAGGAPLKSGFLRWGILGDSGFGLGVDFNDWKQVVTFRALLIRPLQTGLTRHRFCAWTQPCQSTFEQCLPERGADRPGCILTLAIALA
jgi:hypothetical protein